MTYAAQQRTALATLQRKGVQTTITRLVPASIDETRDIAVGGGPESQTVRVVVLPATTNADMTLDQKSDVRKNRRRVLVSGLAADGSALTWDPSQETGQQTIALEGATWIIDSLSRLAPDGGASIYFDGEVRR